jgi:hypothetical protein
LRFIFAAVAGRGQRGGERPRAHDRGVQRRVHGRNLPSLARSLARSPAVAAFDSPEWSAGGTAQAVAVWYISPMDEERIRRARAEAEVARLSEEVELLAAERRRLSLRNERLSAALYVLRDRERDEVVQELIEDALAYDGREPDFSEH